MHSSIVENSFHCGTSGSSLARILYMYTTDIVIYIYIIYISIYMVSRCSF